jgi:hypothetical protein
LNPNWKIHVKNVPRINLQKVAELEGGAESLQRFQHVRKWLEDDTVYEPIALKNSRGCPTTSMRDDWIDSLVKYEVVKPVRRQDVRGHVRMFTVPEPAKSRYRPIKHTVDCNDTLGKDTLLDVKFPTKQQLIDLVHAGDCFIALDFAAYYDQFVYAEHVGTRFCFRRGSSYYRLNTLAMGQRQAVEVAVCTTARILDFSPLSTTASIIDNVIFVGSREDVIRDATIFIQRVKDVNGLLNECTDDIPAMVTTSGVWGGIHLDLTTKQVRLADKTIEKTQVSWSRRNEWTYRNFAAHIGLLFWAWNIIDIPMAEYFPVLRFISTAGRYLTEHEDAWDTPAYIWPSVWSTLEQWTLLVIRNVPRPVPRVQVPDWIVCTDACETGWGYVAVNAASGEVRTHGEPWSQRFIELYRDRLGHSTFSEPQAIVNALCRLFPPNSPARVRVVTDNTVARVSFERMYNKHSYHINNCMRRVYEIFGANLVLDFVYVAGVWNFADSWSRGRTHGLNDEERDYVSAEMRMLWGNAECPREFRLPALGTPFNTSSMI